MVTLRKYVAKFDKIYYLIKKSNIKHSIAKKYPFYVDGDVHYFLTSGYISPPNEYEDFATMFNISYSRHSNCSIYASQVNEIKKRW